MAARLSTKIRADLRSFRALGAASTVGTFLAIGLTPLATAPSARADDFGLLDLVDSAAWTQQWDGIDWGSFVDPVTWGTVLAQLDGFDFSGIASGSPAFGDVWFNDDIYTPLHAAIESGIHSDAGQQFAGFVNGVTGLYLIGDGTAGTAEHPDGGDAGLLLGDGGNGWGYGGSGGNAGWLFGNGGNAGSAEDHPDSITNTASWVPNAAAADPADSTAARLDGAPGVGGKAGFLFGNGGAGTDGGAASSAATAASAVAAVTGAFSSATEAAAETVGPAVTGSSASTAAPEATAVQVAPEAVAGYFSATEAAAATVGSVAQAPPAPPEPLATTAVPAAQAAAVETADSAAKVGCSAVALAPPAMVVMVVWGDVVATGSTG